MGGFQEISGGGSAGRMISVPAASSPNVGRGGNRDVQYAPRHSKTKEASPHACKYVPPTNPSASYCA